MSTVSVIIPSFRGGWLLRDAIASVQAQTMTDWELIVVFDGCEDDLSDLEKGDQRVRSIHQPRRGASIARNVGVSQARSDLIALLDDDDRMLPDRLLLQCAAMADPAVTLSHTQYRIIDQHGAAVRDGEATDCSYLDCLRGESTILTGTLMFKKRTFQEIGGYNPLLPHAEGQDFIYRVARQGKIVFVPQVLYEYRLHDSNVWFGSSSGTEETALVLRQHFFAARAHGEAENLQAVRRALSLIPPPRAAPAVARASKARSQGERMAMFGALAWTFLLAPLFTVRAVWAELSRRSRPPVV